MFGPDAKTFDLFDLNGDGFIDKDEYDIGMKGGGPNQGPTAPDGPAANPVQTPAASR